MPNMKLLKCIKRGFSRMKERLQRRRKSQVGLHVGGPTNFKKEDNPLASLMNLPGNREYIDSEADLGFHHSLTLQHHYPGIHPLTLATHPTAREEDHPPPPTTAPEADSTTGLITPVDEDLVG